MGCDFGENIMNYDYICVKKNSMRNKVTGSLYHIIHVVCVHVTSSWFKLFRYENN